MNHVEGSVISRDGMRLYYQSWLPDDQVIKGAILLLHGWFAHSGWYMSLPEGAVPRGYAVYAYAQRGWGRSEGQRGYLNHWQENLDDLELFVRQVAEEVGRKPIFLMGHTGSSPIVLEYGLNHAQSIQGVFCVSPVLDPSPVLPAKIRMVVHLLSWVAPHWTIDLRKQFNAKAHLVAHNAEFVRLIQTDPLGNTKLSMRMLAEGDEAMQRMQADAEQITFPLLFLIGGADQTVPPEINRTYFERVGSADKELHEYPGAYTNLLSDTCSPEVLRDIYTWLECHLAP